MKIWLDDVVPRPSFEIDLIWIKSAEELIKMIKEHNITFIDFDHDLGEGKKTGYEVACFIEKRAMVGIDPPDYQIHSGNPVGAACIDVAMKRAHAISNRRGFTP